jgi:hypothetical protein
MVESGFRCLNATELYSPLFAAGSLPRVPAVFLSGFLKPEPRPVFTVQPFPEFPDIDFQWIVQESVNAEKVLTGGVVRFINGQRSFGHIVSWIRIEYQWIGAVRFHHVE